MQKKIDKTTAILNALREQAGPISSAKIAELLALSGYSLSERTIRFYLKEFDKTGLTVANGKKGRKITDAGLAELQSAKITQRPDYLSAKIDQMIYRMNFDLPTRSGTVVVNTSVVNPHRLGSFADKIYTVFAKRYGMGRLMTLIGPGETIGELTIPKDEIGFCTVCSITLNGILLKHGIPMTSRFGGLLKLKDGKALRFTEMIHYDGTSIDPLEVFIRSGMTDYHGAIRDGNGLIGASFREVPGESRQRLVNIGERLDEIGLGAIMELGLPGEPLLEIPVSHGRVGAIVVGGLNPIAILEEREHRVFSRALSGLIEYDRLFSYEEFPSQLQKFL
jgi:HTH-type transcriptional regulator, global nitrogen regulator NrpRI